MLRHVYKKRFPRQDSQNAPSKKRLGPYNLFFANMAGLQFVKKVLAKNQSKIILPLTALFSHCFLVISSPQYYEFTQKYLVLHSKKGLGPIIFFCKHGAAAICQEGLGPKSSKTKLSLTPLFSFCFLTIFPHNSLNFHRNIQLLTLIWVRIILRSVVSKIGSYDHLCCYAVVATSPSNSGECFRSTTDFIPGRKRGGRQTPLSLTID